MSVNMIGIDGMKKDIPFQVDDYRFLALATIDRLASDEIKKLHLSARRFSRHRTILLTIVVLLVYAVLLFMEPEVWLLRFYALPEWAITAIGYSYIGLLLIAFTFIDKIRDRIDRCYLYEHLIKMNIRPRFCMKCDYILDGIASAECPECGANYPQCDIQTETDNNDD